MRIFDSLLHPTISGCWFDKTINCNFESLHEQIKKNDFLGGCAVGLWGVEGYDHQTFITACNHYPCLIPIAGFSPKCSPDIGTEIDEIVKLGYRGIKIHPRFSKIDLNLDVELLVETCRRAASADLVVFICTFFSSAIEQFPGSDPFWNLVNIIKRSPATKIILVHGGANNIMNYAELVKFNPQLLLDLSYTIIKYRGSSVEVDIKYLLEHLDQRLCIGSDYPQFSLDLTKATFREISSGIDQAKVENIGHKNLVSFLKRNDT